MLQPTDWSSSRLDLLYLETLHSWDNVALLIFVTITHFVVATQFAFYDQGVDCYWGIPKPYGSMIFNAFAINRKGSHFIQVDRLWWCTIVIYFYLNIFDSFLVIDTQCCFWVEKSDSLVQLMYVVWGTSLLFRYSRCPMLQVPPKLYSKNHWNLRSVNSLQLIFARHGHTIELCFWFLCKGSKSLFKPGAKPANVNLWNLEAPKWDMMRPSESFMLFHVMIRLICLE